MKVGRPKNKVPNVSVHVSLPKPLADDIDKYADRKDWSLSKTCAKLIKTGWGRRK